MSILALAGGVGGAKLAHGLYRALPPNTLTIVVNTGDDFDLHGLRICPDADTILYTLAGLANEETGWGIAGDTWSALAMFERYGEAAWFRVGDRDLATHVLRTARLRAGATLTQVLGDFARALGVRATLLPMCDEPAPTMIQTPAGELDFQDYFVRRQHADLVIGARYAGIEAVRAPDGVRAAVAAAEAIIFCPSNPIVSIGPILAVPGMRALLEQARMPRIAVSPLVGGRALRGPADAMLQGLGIEPTAYGVAALYRGLLDGFVLDTQDAADAPRIAALGMRPFVTDAIMRTVDDRERLAHEVVGFIEELRGEERG